MSVDAVTLKIPRPLYERLQELIEGAGFRSPTEFVLSPNFLGAECRAWRGKTRQENPAVPSKGPSAARRRPPGRSAGPPAAGLVQNVKRDGIYDLTILDKDLVVSGQPEVKG